MASVPLRKCIEPGCRKLIRGSARCAEHEVIAKRDAWRRADASRLSSSKRGYNARWRRFRQYWLARHPLCEECMRRGRTTAASVVDHIVPHRGDCELFWQDGNVQSLCVSCHARKTRRGE